MSSVSTISANAFTITLADLSESEFRSARRVIVNADLLKASKLSAGDVVALVRAESSNSSPISFAVGIIWPSLDISSNSLLVSSSLLLTAQLEEGSKVHIRPLSDKIVPGIPSLREAKEAGTIRLRETFLDPHIPSTRNEIKEKRQEWLALLLKESLVDLKYITNAQILDVSYEGRIRRFCIDAVSSHQFKRRSLVEDLRILSVDASPELWIVGWESLIILDGGETKVREDSRKTGIESILSSPSTDAYRSVGGLDRQIVQIRDLIEIPLTRPDLFQHFGLKPPRGILLHGPPGTGKTHLARAIAASSNSSILIVNGPELSSAYHGETESKIRNVFSEAYSKSPCIVVLDEVDALCPKREDGPGGEVEKRVVATLLTIMDGMKDDAAGGEGARVVVVATTNRPNAIDPALRRPGRFDREIEIGIPDADARLSILQVLLSKTPHKLSQEDLRAVASAAHGYVGADLSAVVRESGTIAIKRWLGAATAGAAPSSMPELLLSDLLCSLPVVRPSALRSVFVESPPVRYSEIGGQSHVIDKLRETIEWPLKHPEAFTRLGAKAPKGVLLYGPPGCSKTLLVRACATESGINFVAVKGPELLNKYVGESERAVRETFRKARSAAPCIVFFDEIDALATSRSPTSSSSDDASHGGVLTSLLNEMDGVQELVGVTVVAATNRPEVIDSALMRPGRLDRLLYVGPPDLQGREEILSIRLAKMSVEPELDIRNLAEVTEGCSGAEIVALCQEAALLTMKEDINAPYVPQQAFIAAAQAMKRQITLEVVAKFERWRDGSGSQ